MNKSPQYTLQGEPEQCKSEVWEMYLPKGITWTSISEITVAMLENLSEETKSETRQIKEQYETIKFPN